MNFLAMRMLVGDRLKYLSLVAGLAFAALLVTQQASIFCGYALRTGSWIHDERCCDLWVMDDQADFTEANKDILDTALDRVRGVSGVLWAVPMYKGYLKCRLPDGTALSARVIGVDDATLIGAPARMVEGRTDGLRRDRAVFINADQAGDGLLLKRANPPRPLRVGDSIAINDNEAIVAGAYRATPEFFWDPVFYTTFSRALAMAPSERRTTTYVLVKVRPGSSISEVAGRIGRIPGLKAVTGDQFAAMTMDYVLKKTGILVNFGITIGLGFLIGVLVSGQTLYTFMLDNMKHFATLKAMGAGNLAIIKMVGLQAAWVGGIGYGIGVGGAAFTGFVFSKIGVAFEMPWQIPVIGAVAILLCCVAAAIFSLVRVLRLDPAVVFKG
ncbi:MAG: ABC transporter permease [Tepidisphaeraceae bacterium]|jgi:putative ABC transport system permease protein